MMGSKQSSTSTFEHALMAASLVSNRMQAVLTALNRSSAAGTHVQDFGCADGVHTVVDS